MLRPLLSCLLLLSCACQDQGDSASAAFLLEAPGSQLELREEGWFDLYDMDGAAILLGAHAALMLDAADDTGRQLSTLDEGQHIVVQASESDALGDAQRLSLTRLGAEGEPALIWTISAYQTGAYSFRLTASNPGEETLTLCKASALRVDGDEEGGLFLGDHPSTHRILENGQYAALDMTAEVLPGDVEASGFGSIAPGDYQGHSAASWNHAVADLDSDAAWVAGGLSFESSMPVINLSYDESDAQSAPDGRTGFSYFSAEAAWEPECKPLEPGASFSSELYYVHPTPVDALQGLEDYAQAVADWLDITPWHRRAEGRRVANGWNSWAGSGSTGGYGTDINQEMALENLDIMATELRDWGMDWFQLDDGYEPAYGDWTWNKERFPKGPAWLTEQIRAAGLRPGLWIAPFTAHDDSELYQDHPDWFADETMLGQVIGGEYEVLDLTHPEVLDWLAELTDTFRNDWGFEWLKLDFGYHALFGTGFYQADATREEAWRGAMKVIDEGLGEDAFFMLVGNLGTNYDIIDAGRLTLDSMPLWEWEPDQDSDDHLEQQGLKPIMRTSGRRWYLQDRVWINHPDLIFFRSNTHDKSWPRLTLDESQAFCTYVALSGGIVKLGDRLVDLDADAINTIRAILPIYGVAARPLDVFTTEYPEIWHMPVDAPLDGFDEPYHLLGLFNWGFNVDQTTNPYSELKDDGSDRQHSVDLAALGLDGQWLAYEFWTGSYLGTVSSQLDLDVPSHTGRVVALRQPTGAPQFLGWNRNITMGATVLGAVTWDEGSQTLSLDMTTAVPTEKAPFTYEMAFYVPSGQSVSDVQFSGAAVEDEAWESEGEVLRVSFIPQETGALEVELSF